RERQGLIEARIGDIESKLANAQEIDPRLLDAEGRCVFGATVDVEEDGGEKATWQIVGEDEADIKAGKISYSSPLGRALTGKESGEKVDVQTPGGVRAYANGTRSWSYRYQDYGVTKLLHVIFDSGDRVLWYYSEWDPRVYSKKGGGSSGGGR